MKKKKHPRQGACIPAKDLSDLMTDEQHIAAALYKLTRAAGGLYSLHEYQIHACLRDAAMHCEAARLHWTRKERARIAALGRQLFGDPK